MVLSRVQREGEIYPITENNSNCALYEINERTSNVTSNMDGNNNIDDSDDSDEMPDFDDNEEDPKVDVRYSRPPSKQEKSCNAPSIERRVSKEGGDVYNNTIRAQSVSSLTIGPVVENHHQVKRHRRISTCSSSNNLSAGNSSNSAIPNIEHDNIKDTVLEMLPTSMPTNNDNVILEDSSSDEEDKDHNEHLDNTEDNSRSAPPSKAQFDTKVNIRMPNEGPPKIEIQQQIENNYLGPVYILDAETTKQIILANPSIVAQICDREMANIPKINHTKSLKERNEENLEGQNEKNLSISNAEKGSCSNRMRQNVQWNQKSFRKRNQRQHDDCSNDMNKVNFSYQFYVIVII